MKVAFADSTFYVALLISRDANHAKAAAVALSWTEGIVTTEYVLTEVANHLSSSENGRARFGRFLADLKADPNTELLESSHELWEHGVSL